MDSDDSVTFEIQSLFYQGAYRSCVDVVSQNTSGSPSDPTTLTRLLYGARSQLALNQPDAALALLPSSDIPDSDSPAAAAVRALSRFVKAQNKGDQSGSDEELHQLNELLDQAVLGDANGQTIRICVATAMMRDDDPVGALETLGMGTASSKEIERCVFLPWQPVCFPALTAAAPTLTTQCRARRPHSALHQPARSGTEGVHGGSNMGR